MLLLVSKEIASIGIWLVSGIYKVAAFTFKIFTILAQGKLIDTDAYQTIIDNFYVILGVAMLFAIAFSLLRGMVNPDDQKQGTSSIKKIIINLITSTIILAFLPSIFSFAFDFQDSILSYNTIGGFFGFGTLGKADTTPEGTTKVEQISYRMVNGVWTAFFNVDVSHDKCISLKSDYPKPLDQLVECQEIITTNKKVTLYTSEGGAIEKGEVSFLKISNEVDNTGNFNLYDAFSQNIEDGEVDFQWFLALIGGLALIYIGFSYCFDMALRLIKLVFYQIIAPIPLFLRIIPDNKLSGTFKQWLKITLTCWAEVFVRIFIFYFCIYLCNAMLSEGFFTDTVYQYGTLVGLFSQAFIIMGIIMFMKRSPKLLSEITGIDSGNMKLGIKDKFKEVTSAVDSLPLVGTALRGTGTLGKKLLSGWDAKRNGYNFSDGWKRFEGNGPYAKYKKWRDNFLPYSAANAESRKKAEEQVGEIEKKQKRGEEFAKKLKNDLTEAYKNGNMDLLDKVLEIKDKNGNKIALKDASPEMIQKAIDDAGAGEFIKHLAATSNNGDYQALGKTYNQRSEAKAKMLAAKAEMEAAQQSGDNERIAAANKKFSEMNDSYEAIDNEWKQRLAALNNKKEIGGYNAMKFNEDRGKALSNDNSYQATRNGGTSDASSGFVIPPSYGVPRAAQNSFQFSDNDFDELLKYRYDYSSEDEKARINKVVSDFEHASTQEERERIKKDFIDSLPKH